MIQRSLQASVEGIKAAEKALISKFSTQQRLADALGVTRQPVNRFFNRKPVDKSLFVQICEKLGLEWEEVADFLQSEVEESSEQDSDIDALVEEIREQVKPSIKERCGTMRVLDMTQPIELTGERGIYTNVNILEKITGRRRLDIPELLQNCDVEDFERFGLSRVTEKRVPGLEAVKRYSKLMVLGKPGAGKTTFLKYLAMQCIEGLFQANRVPLFITLKDFAETPGQPDLLTYLSLWDGHLARPRNGADRMSTPQNVSMLRVLQQGQALVLLDGLDEVREEDTKRVLRQIREVSDQFHTNQFVITCRIAAKEYTFERFAEVEVADFDKQQIAIFAEKWFREDPDNCHAERSDSEVKHLSLDSNQRFFAPLRSAQNDKAQKFIQKLEQNKPIQELASNPLLLTMLCLVFGEAGNFPTNRSELYKEGLDVLLKKWDAKRNIERDQVYKNLSLQRKEDLLSQIALTTFEQKDYFFKQKTIEAYIADFICNLRDAPTKPKELELDSEAVLKSIEAQHGLLVERAKGIYSFSHLTFQEYFAAREIVANSAWESSVEHITEKRWREVFLLTATMMRKADDFVRLMKQEIDNLLAGDEKLQQFLAWAEEKSHSVEAPYKPAAVRAFYSYFALIHSCIKELIHPNRSILAYVIDSDFRSDIANGYASADDIVAACGLSSLFSSFAFIFSLPNDIALDIALALVFDDDFAFFYALRSFILIFELELELAPQFKHELQLLMNQLPSHLNNWCEEDREAWRKHLHSIMIEHRNIGHDWQFTNAQKQLLQQYYDANKLLVDCLNSDCYVSWEVRQEIEETLLLPMAEIEKRQR
jgi:predicted NACHT family NTPase